MSSPSRDATLLSDELRALLGANDVPMAIQNEIAKAGYFTTKAFANSCDAAKEVLQFIDSSSLKDDEKKTAYALLKQAWKEADATVARGIRRMAEGLTDTVLDEALPDTTKNMIHETFQRRYAWNLEFKLRPSDALLGRVRREFERGCPTMYPVNKVKSFFQQSRSGEPKRHKMGEHVSAIFDQDFDEPSPTVKFRHLMSKMEVLVNTWALAGCFVPKKDNPGSSSVAPNMRLMCEWPEAVKYFRDIRDSVEPILDSCTEASVCEYFLAVEEDLRQRALDHMREFPDKMFGESLLWAADKFQSVYYTHTKLLYNRSGGGASTSSSIVPAPHHATVVAGAKHQADKAQASEPKGKIVTGLKTDKGSAVCKRYNDRRGCQQPCKDGKAHVCDALLTNNRICQQRHPRFEHDASKHGKIQTRS